MSLTLRRSVVRTHRDWALLISLAAAASLPIDLFVSHRRPLIPAFSPKSDPKAGGEGDVVRALENWVAGPAFTSDARTRTGCAAWGQRFSRNEKRQPSSCRCRPP